MFIETKARNVISSGVKDETSFKIKASAKAFNVLINTLYSDKVRAVIRELWSNAYDSHVAAGKKDVSFDCCMPTYYEPEFRVRDYGTSLSHEDVMHVYNTIFESTKENTNDENGMLGLGSKSPLAYTDSFSITCWLNGEKRHYSSYIDSNGFPKTAHMHTEESDEPQGLEVRFAVNADDVSTFETRARRVAWAFDVLPNFVGEGLGVENLSDLTPLTTGANGDWRLYDSTYDTRKMGDGAHARQGCVLYPIDGATLDKLTEGEKELLKAQIIIDFPMGSLDVAPSREGLSYDPQTSANITNKIKEIAEELRADVKAELAKANSLWEATIVYNRVTERYFSSRGQVTKVFGEKLKFKGRQLKRTVEFNRHRGGKPINPDLNNMCTLVKKHSSIAFSPLISDVTTRAWQGKWMGDTDTFHFNPADMMIYVQYTDEHVSYAGARIHEHAFKGAGCHKFLWIRAPKNSMKLKRALISLGRPPQSALVEVNALPVPPKDSSARSRSNVQCQVLTNHGWEREDISSDRENVLYVETVRNTYVNRAMASLRTADVFEVLKMMKDKGVIPEDTIFVSVPASKKKIIQKSGDTWQEAIPIIKAYIKKVYTVEVEAYNCAVNISSNSQYSHPIRSLVELCLTYDIMPERSNPLYKTVAGWRVINRLAQRYGRKSEVLARMNGTICAPFNESEVQLAVAKLPIPNEKITDENVPMLKFAFQYRYSSIAREEVRTLLDYIALIGKL